MDASDPRLAALREVPGATAYVPRLLPAWAAAEQAPAHRVVDGSLLLFDITGFTPLTERLARRGREGAEELSNLLDTVFSQLLMDAEDEGGDLLKWGGDALLLLYDGADHGRRAARAGMRMHRALAQIGHAKTTIGRVMLRAPARCWWGTQLLRSSGQAWYARTKAGVISFPVYRPPRTVHRSRNLSRCRP